MDVLVLHDTATAPGLVLKCKIIGVLEVVQKEKGKKGIRNDRLIAVATRCQDFRMVKSLGDLDANLLAQIEHFFVSYNEISGKKFKPIGRPNAHQAKKIMEEGQKRFQKQGAEK